MNFGKAIMVAGLAIGIAGSVFAQDGGSILGALKNSEAVASKALNAGHSKHDKDGDGRDEHMDGKKGNGYGHNGGGHNGGGNGGGGNPPNCVPEPASMLAMGAGAGFLAWKKRRAAKKA